jgi:hypothetical protein
MEVLEVGVVAVLLVQKVAVDLVVLVVLEL